MRHNKSFNHLSRTSSHRKAMLSNMAASLIMHKRINTTVAKAKALRGFVEPLITKAKEDTTHNRRVAFRYLGDKDAVSELFRDVVGKVGDRPGGYTRILKTEHRLGDNAEMCIIELVDYNEAMLATKETKKKSRRRSRKPKTDAPQVETIAEEVIEEVVEAKVEEAAEVKVEVKEEAPEAKAEEAKKDDKEEK